MKKIVIAFGGSLIDFDRHYFKRFSDLISNLSKDMRVFIVVGGGRIAREYINFGREMGFNERRLDDLGIDITRVNARLISYMLGIYTDIPKSTDEAKYMDSKIVIMGGTTPGHSTDAVAAELAEKVEADILIIATDVNGIYDKDPKRYKDAKLFDRISLKELIQRYGVNWKKAGENVIIDGPALEIMNRCKYKIVVLNGKNLENLSRAIYGKKFIGTKIEREMREV